MVYYCNNLQTIYKEKKESTIDPITEPEIT